MTFYKWVILFKDVDLPIGDLAKDIFFDEKFPKRSKNYKQIYDYLAYEQNACLAAINCFENVWKAYLLKI